MLEITSTIAKLFSLFSFSYNLEQESFGGDL